MKLSNTSSAMKVNTVLQTSIHIYKSRFTLKITKQSYTIHLLADPITSRLISLSTRSSYERIYSESDALNIR